MVGCRAWLVRMADPVFIRVGHQGVYRLRCALTADARLLSARCRGHIHETCAFSKDLTWRHVWVGIFSFRGVEVHRGVWHQSAVTYTPSVYTHRTDKEGATGLVVKTTHLLRYC